jgi:acyl dehydratase
VETVGLGLFFEDLPVGRKFKTIGRTLTETDLVNYVNCLGLVEVLFTSAEFREKDSEIKGRFVPALLVQGFCEGLLVQAVTQHSALALLNLEVKIERPAYVGDTIHAEVEVIEARLSRSRPGRGLVRSTVRAVRQNGEVILVYTLLRMMKCRDYSHS